MSTNIQMQKHNICFSYLSTTINIFPKIKQKKRDPLAEMFDTDLRNQLTFLNLLHTIKGAGKDWRIKGIFLRLDNNFKMGLAQCEELRRTLIEFRYKYNKKIVVYADNLSYWGKNAIRHYYIASSADRIFMSNDGNLFLGPLTINFPFFKNTLNEKLNIEFEVRRRSQYKSAGNIFVRDKFDEHHRQQHMQLLSNIELNFIDCIAKARRLRPYSIQKHLKNSKQQHTLKCLQWIVGQMLEKEQQLEFRNSISNSLLNGTDMKVDEKIDENVDESNDCSYTRGIFESKADDDEEEANEILDSSEIANFDCNLVHCWSYFLGNYKLPKFYCILQFYDKKIHLEVFYEVVVRLPTKNKGTFIYIFIFVVLSIFFFLEQCFEQTFS